MVDWKEFGKIEGLIDIHEAKALYSLVQHTSVDGVLLDLGTKHGYSAAIMAYAARLSGGKVITVDKEKSSLQDNLNLIQQLGIEGRIEFINDKIEDISWNLPIKGLFMDASHTYGDVKRDFTRFEPWVSSGGFIAIHDAVPLKLPANYMGVWKNLSNYFDNDGTNSGPEIVFNEFFNYDKFEALGKIQCMAYGVKK